MYGLVKTYTPDLLVREDSFYKSVYCGLCRSMSRHTTEMSCASLSFDMTLFALVRIWSTGERCHIEKKRCYVHPLKKKNMMTDNPSLQYTAYVNAILAYYKIQDNVNDSKGIKRMFWKLALLFGKGPMKKVPADYKDVGDNIVKNLNLISECERNKCDIPSEPAEAFGDLLGFSMSYGLEKNREVVYELGRKIGRWVYLADALCDLEEDAKSGSYNPFLLSLGLEESRNFKKEDATGVLYSELNEAYNAFLLGPDEHTEAYGCISNIIRKGMMNSYLGYQKKKGKNDGKKSI